MVVDLGLGVVGLFGAMFFARSAVRGLLIRIGPLPGGQSFSFWALSVVFLLQSG